MPEQLPFQIIGRRYEMNIAVDWKEKLMTREL